MPSSIDILATSPVLAHAISGELETVQGLRIGLRTYAWQDYAQHIESSATLLVLDAFLDDHVPLALKLRATRRLETRTVVFGSDRGSSYRQRAEAEGAVDWIPLTASLTELGERVARASRTPFAPNLPAPGADQVVVELSDRQLQLLTMYCSRRAGRREALARAMGITESTVAVHLREGRARLDAAGFDVSSRTKLEAALVELGYAVPQEEWRAQRRW